MVSEYCTVHLKWTPCLGRHQRRDSGESCFYETNKHGAGVVRDVHSGVLTLEQGRNRLDNLGLEGREVEWALDLSDY